MDNSGKVVKNSASIYLLSVSSVGKKSEALNNFIRSAMVVHYALLRRAW